MPSRRDMPRQRRQAKPAESQATVLGWVQYLCGMLGGVALIAVLAMLGAGMAGSQTQRGATRKYAEMAWEGAAEPDATCMMMDTTSSASLKAKGGGELWAVLDRGCTQTTN